MSSRMNDSDVDEVIETKDIDYRAAKKQDHEQSLVSNNEVLGGTQEELVAALAFFEKLKPLVHGQRCARRGARGAAEKGARIAPGRAQDPERG
ncbi:hypothetical protein N9L68_03225 [bacterium]|nr:hypothetical protein [bacterium]